MNDHVEVGGIIPMRPGIRPGATCSCGWHSHTRTFEEHIAQIAKPQEGS